MNKRKILLVATALCLVAVLVAGGTMAYFTDTDEATNVFTMGHVSIRQDEWERQGTAIEEYTQGKEVYPAVHDNLVPKESVTVDGYTFDIRSQKGNYADKIVNVTNEGTQEAYIRTIIAIPSMNGYDDGSPMENPLHWNYLDAGDNSKVKGEGWDWNGSNDADVTTLKCYNDPETPVEIGGVEYDLYVATYNVAVPANATTMPSLVGFYLDDSVDYDDDASDDGYTGYFSIQNGERINLGEWIKVGNNGMASLEILVATQAVQTKGFANAWEALDAAFGAISADNHPWAE